MSEKGSDELLREVGATGVDALVDAERQRQAAEEARVQAAAPAVMEPGDDFPDPDEIPPGDPPDYDPMPPEAPS